MKTSKYQSLIGSELNKRCSNCSEYKELGDFHRKSANKVDYDEMCRRWSSLGIDFYTETPTPINPWIRLTLPFALVTLILMLAWTPFKFIFTGEWGYSLSENNRILNWFKALRLQ